MRRRRTRGDGGLTQRPNGKWQAQVSLTEGGKRVRKSETFILKSDAEWWLREARRGNAPDLDRTVKDFLNAWLRGKRKIRDSTRALYRSHLETHIIPALGGFTLTELQHRHVEAFVGDLERKLKPSTVRGVLTTLRMALEHGVNRRELPDNPAKGVEAPDDDREPVTPLTPGEAIALLEAVAGSWMEQLVIFLLASGVRIGEAVALNQGDVHAGYVAIRRAKTVARAARVPPTGMDALREAIRKAPRHGPNEPIFYGPQSGDRLSRATVTHALPKLLERAGVRRMTPHSLRHGTATLMLARGAPMKVIAEQLGHANPAMTARVYAHVVPALQEEWLADLDAVISGGRQRQRQRNP